MPSIIYKKPIADELRSSMPPDVVDLMLGSSPEVAGLLSSLYSLIGETAGSIELAYRRGYEVGFAEERNSMSCPICTDEDNVRQPICGECWELIGPMRDKLAELGYEVTRQEMTETWCSQIVFANTLYDGNENEAWMAALHVHFFVRKAREARMG